jgi:hypothetical protein
MHTINYWNLENEYLASLGNEAPNADILTAARAARTDGDLAETALARADLHTPMTDLVAAAAAYSSLRLDDCLGYASAAEAALPSPDKQFAQRLVYQSAVATFRWAVAKQIDPKLSVFNNLELAAAQLLPPALREFQAEPADPMQRPGEVFKTLSSTDQTDEIKGLGLPGDDKSISDADVAELHDSKEIRFEVPAGHYHRAAFGPRGANVDFRAPVHYRTTGDEKSEWESSFNVSLKTNNPHEGVINLVIFDRTGMAKVAGPHLPTCWLDVNQFCGRDKPFDVHIVAVGGRAEIEINEHPIFYGPLPVAEPDRKLCVGMTAVGVTGKLDHISWKTADARAEK